MLNKHKFKNGINKILIDFPVLVYTIDLDLIYGAIKQREANVIGEVSMKFAKEPTYKQYITGEVPRFDDRNTAFSRGHVEGNKYTAMHNKCITNFVKNKAGKSIIDHATFAAGPTVDYVVRKNLLGREMLPVYNKDYNLKSTDPELQLLVSLQQKFLMLSTYF